MSDLTEEDRTELLATMRANFKRLDELEDAGMSRHDALVQIILEGQRRRYDQRADAAWSADPQAAFRRYGLPCWCGHYGGCTDCEITSI